MTGRKKELCNLNPQKKWGGRRENGGFKPKWKHSPTKLVRVPQALEEPILAYAHSLDDSLAGDEKAVFSSFMEEREAEVLYGDQGLIQPDERGQAKENLRQQTLTLEAVKQTVTSWREEAKKHKRHTPRWAKTFELIEELETHLHNPWI